jgi:hypothetical protein
VGKNRIAGASGEITMQGHVTLKRIDRTCFGPKKRVDQYYSVEFAVEGLESAYQFKIWNKTSTHMSILVKENSEVLPQLKVGDTLNMRYYSDNLIHPSECLETAIRRITRNDQGRLKGHYLVGLELLQN